MAEDQEVLVGVVVEAVKGSEGLSRDIVNLKQDWPIQCKTSHL